MEPDFGCLANILGTEVCSKDSVVLSIQMKNISPSRYTQREKNIAGFWEGVGCGMRVW